MLSCRQPSTLKAISVADFSDFVKNTNYVTDAEKFGWSFVQQDVFNFKVVDGVNWRIPNGQDSCKNVYPITQVSFNDALAYCEWADVRLPSYDEFWDLTESSSNLIIENTVSIHPIGDVHIVGNVWDITSTRNSSGEVRLAGGSYLCNKTTCDGTNKNRVLYVDGFTGNSHIGFSVVE